MISKINLKLSACIFILAIIVIGSLANFPVLNKIASALDANNYNKPTGGQLTVDDWNRLDEDFLARNGGNSMAVDLNMGNHRITNLTDPQNDNEAVTRGAMNTAISNAVSGASSISNTNGNSLKMVCGSTPLTLSNTTQYGALSRSHIRVSFNTGTTFASVPVYFASLQGSYSFLSYGAENVYPVGSNQLALQITFLGENRDGQLTGTGAQGTYLDPQQAVNWGWALNWCAIGN